MGYRRVKKEPLRTIVRMCLPLPFPKCYSPLNRWPRGGPEISNKSPFCVLAKQFRRQTSIDAFKKCPINKAQNGISARQLRVFIMGTV